MRDVRDKRGWLIGIAWKIAHRRKRRAKARPVPEDVSIMERNLAAGQLSPKASNTTQQACDRVLRLVDKLPQKGRDVLLLSAVNELSTLQIAAILGTTEFSVRSRLCRARREFSALLAEGVSLAIHAGSNQRIQAAPVA